MNTLSHQDFKNFLTDKSWSQLKKGHPWIFENQLKKGFPRPPKPSIGHLGEHWFQISPQGSVALRRIGPSARNWATEFQQNFTDDFITSDSSDKRLSIFWEKTGLFLEERLRLKKNLTPEDSCFRWIFGENDSFPGLIVDVFSKSIVVQIQTAVVDGFWPRIHELLINCWENVYGSKQHRKWIELRNHRFRKTEGLEIVEPLKTDFHETLETWKGLKWLMTPAGGQKTGAYLDQGENHLKTARWSKTLNLHRAWDLFCFEGGFGMHLLGEGMSSVSFVDASEQALAKTQKNLQLNHLETKKFSLTRSDGFEFLRGGYKSLEQDQQSPDLIILDPPSFSKSSEHKTNALNAYRDLNLQALKIIQKGGLLVSCSCSQTMTKSDFLEMLRHAAHGARKSVQILEISGPSPDHAPALEFPEGDYLQAWYLRVL